jgi:speckle-type POZ protein
MAFMAQKTASTHRSAVVRGTHEFHIDGWSGPKRFPYEINSGSFLVGGNTWALACSFDNRGVSSITLKLLVNSKEVVATAAIRIEDPHGEWPPAVWRTDEARRFEPGSPNSYWYWELKVPDAYRGHETHYLRDDRLTIQCTVEVLEAAGAVETRSCLVSVVPPPTISEDLHKLLLIDQSESGSRQIQTESEKRRRLCMQPDVTFVVEEETEIQAHKMVLATRSPVFAAEFRWHTNKSASHTRLSVDDMTASTFRAMLRFIYTDRRATHRSKRPHDPRCLQREMCVQAPQCHGTRPARGSGSLRP